MAREYNLVGKNNLEAAKADSVVDTCIDLMTAFYNKVFLVSDAKDKVFLRLTSIKSKHFIYLETMSFKGKGT